MRARIPIEALAVCVITIVTLAGCRTPEAQSSITPPKTTARPTPRLKAVIPIPPTKTPYSATPILYDVERNLLDGGTFEVEIWDGTNWIHTLGWMLSDDGEDLIVPADKPMAVYRVKAWLKTDVER